MAEPAHTRPAERRRVEIVHESLLTNWPRLVRWQTQDADGARVRDELRQAARLWEEHGRSEDRLWTGTAFRELQLWRERYSGGLTELEEAFANAATAFALRRRNRRWLIVTLSFVLLVAALGAFASLWRSSEAAHHAAEASQLLALGQLEIDEEPGAALAYALASLEIHDSEAARLLALRALSRSPLPRLTEDPAYVANATFTPDGQSLVTAGYNGLSIHRRQGGPRRALDENHEPGPEARWLFEAALGPDPGLMAVVGPREPTRVDLWSIAEERLLRSYSAGGVTLPVLRRDALYLLTRGKDWRQGLVRRWQPGADSPEEIGRWDLDEVAAAFDLDTDANLLVSARGRTLYARPLRNPPGSAIGERLVGEHAAEIFGVAADPLHPLVASGDVDGEVRVWSLAPGVREPLRIFRAPGRAGPNMVFDPAGRWLAVEYREPFRPWYLWRLDGPEGAAPLVLQTRSPVKFGHGAAFTPDGKWIAANVEKQSHSLHFFPLSDHYPTTLRSLGYSARPSFAPRGDELLAGFTQGSLESWDLQTGRHRVLWKVPGKAHVFGLAVEPGNARALATIRDDGAFLVSLVDGKARRIADLCTDSCTVSDASIRSDGSQAAFTVFAATRPDETGIRILDLRTEKVETLAASRGEIHGRPTFAHDGALFSVRRGDGTGASFYRWDPRTGGRTEVAKLRIADTAFAIGEDGRYLAAIECLLPQCSEFVNARTGTMVRLFDLEHRTSRPVPSHGDRIVSVAIDSERSLLATGSSDGTIRIGPLTGEMPHLLPGVEDVATTLAFDPKGRWLATGDDSSPVVRLWPLPDSSRPPLYTLPYDRLLEKLRSMTNLRVVAEAASPTGYKLDVGPFPGWETVPEW